MTGRAGDEQIDAELARDNTDAGRREAATCRASVPDAAHKAAAWALVVDSADAGIEESALVARAFNQPEHASLLAPYTEKYLEALPVIWATKDGLLRVFLGGALFPFPAASPQLLDRIEEYLSQPGLEPGLVRAVVEGRDVVQKALRSRALPA